MAHQHSQEYDYNLDGAGKWPREKPAIVAKKVKRVKNGWGWLAPKLLTVISSYHSNCVFRNYQNKKQFLVILARKGGLRGESWDNFQGEQPTNLYQ